MKGRPIEDLSQLEREVIAEIRAMKTSTGTVHSARLLEHPAHLINHLILASHGSVQLRMFVMARELGIGMRTLERAFFREYRQTMAQCQTEARLSYSKSMLSTFPPTKVSVVAAVLGYGQLQDFNRFFRKHMRRSPSAWGIEERERIGREGKQAPRS